MSTEERLQADKNSTRQRRSKLQGMASKFGLSEDEVRMLAAAGLMMPDPFDAMMIGDPERRVDAVQDYSSRRVQYTNLMIPPRDIEAYLDGERSIKIDSKPFLKNERSLSDLMVAVRGSAKILDGIGAAYAEQHAFHRELLRLVVERQQMSRVMRSSPPKYLLDFARLLESLGCERNDLRSVDGRLVRLIREHVGLTDEAAGRSVDNDVARFRAWLAEEEELGASDGDDQDGDDEFDRLSKIAARALMEGDLDAARAAFADLERFDASLEDSFGSSGSAASVDGDDDGGDDDRAGAPNGVEDLVEAGPRAVSAETGDAVTAGPNTGSADSDGRQVSAGRALTAEGDDGVSALSGGDENSSSPVSGNDDARPGIEPTGGLPSEGPAGSASPSKVEAATPVEPSLFIPPEPVSGPGSTVPEPVSTAATTPASPPASPPSSPMAKRTPVYLTGWAVTTPEGASFSRVSGIGRLPGNDAFGGVVSMAAQTPEVIPMWERADRPASTGDRLGLDDWYRFEVPFGSYALVHMPKRLTDYLPVRSEMFPPYADLERYGVQAGFSPADMRALKVAEMGRGSMEIAIRAVRAVLIMTYGKDDEDLLRFWMFLLVGRRFMDRVDLLFPHGYFHGVMAPDPAAKDVGTGLFRIVRILDDGDLANQMRAPKFAPFGSPDGTGNGPANGSSPTG